MNRSHRREFLADVGRGMLVASVGRPRPGPGLGLRRPGRRLREPSDVRPMEPLVALMQETPADRLFRRSSSGSSRRPTFGRLVAAAALANARTFGGQDYEGYHALMALVPAYQMSRELPEAQKALPVLKVLYRNTNHIQQLGGHAHEALHAVAPAELSAGQCAGEALREATRRRDVHRGRANLCRPRPRSRSPTPTTTSSTWSRITSTSTASSWPGEPGPARPGRQGACHTLLRQSVRFCCDEEKPRQERRALRALLPRAARDQGPADRLAQAARGDRPVDRIS